MNYEFFTGPSLGRSHTNYFTDDRLFRDLFFQDQEFNYLDQFVAWDNFDGGLFHLMRDNYLKHIKRVTKGIIAIEKAAIRTLDADDEGGIAIYKSRISYQRQLVASLKERLESIKTPAHLREHVAEIKVGLMQAWVIDIQLKTNSLELLAAKGEEFTRPRSRGCDALGNVILSLLQEHGKEATAKSVFKMLEDLVDPVNPHPTIQSVEDGVVYWRSARGNEKKTAFGSIENRLTEYKRKV